MSDTATSEQAAARCTRAPFSQACYRGLATVIFWIVCVERDATTSHVEDAASLIRLRTPTGPPSQKIDRSAYLVEPCTCACRTKRSSRSAHGWLREPPSRLFLLSRLAVLAPVLLWL